jgi:hypothetical protein
MDLKPNKPVHPVALGEPFDEIIAVFVNAASEIIRHADIESAVPVAC